MLECDVLVVGGGSAGCVVAARLSEEPRRKVILIEAGDDTPPDNMPADVSDTFPSSAINPAYFWPDLEASFRAGATPRRYPQARIMGGGSNITGLISLRGMPSDYDSWAQAGAKGWRWHDVLVSFRQAEKDLDRFTEDDRRGAFPLSRVQPEKWPAYLTAMQGAAERLGFPLVDDINERPQDGFFAVPLSKDASGRATTARCYLTKEVRLRRNLTVLPNTTAISIITEGRRAAGVVVERASEAISIFARQTILCAGAIHSPALLLRSGIGARSRLSKLGITCVADRAGVGRNLQNHVYLHYAVTLPREGRVAPEFRHYSLAGMRFSSHQPGCPLSDLILLASGRASPRRFGTGVALIMAALYTPFSRGGVRLRNADYRVAPEIDFNMFADERDAPRMLAAARMVERLLLEPSVCGTYHEAFLLPTAMGLSQFNRPSLGALMDVAANIAVNAPTLIRRKMIEGFFREVHWLERQQPGVNSTAILDAVAPMGHPTGTCLIGSVDDPDAVVDSRCRVIGIDGLRVADASVMPVIPSANTNLPSIMIGEHVATLVDAESSIR